jgi:hypothetical protein
MRRPRGFLTARPTDRVLATPAQINKLVAMLHEADEINAPFNPKLGERDYYESDVIVWIAANVGYKVTSLDLLTNQQIGKCYQELGG